MCPFSMAIPSAMPSHVMCPIVIIVYLPIYASHVLIIWCPMFMVNVRLPANLGICVLGVLIIV